MTGRLDEPLLSKVRRTSLTPLYTVTFIQAVAFCVAMLPAFSLRFRELAAERGWDAAETAAAFGRLSAMRSLCEFAATPTLASWSDAVGRRPVLMLCCAAFCLQFSILAASSSLLCFGASYVAFGLLSDSNGALESTCIADATPVGSERSVAFGRFFTVIGAAMVVGPAVGGSLASRDGRAPFAAAAFLAFCGLGYMAFQLPEYRPVRSSRESGEKKTSMLRDFCQLLLKSPSLGWYVAASALAGMGMGAFGSVQVLWLREAFGWDGDRVGKFLSTSGILLMMSQALILPRLLSFMRGRESTLALLGLLITAGKLVGYGLAPTGASVFAVQLAGVAGTCSVPSLRSVCSRCVPESCQGTLSGAIAAITTATGVAGSLMGSNVFAASLRRGWRPGNFLFLASACYVFAAACVARGASSEGKREAKREELP